MKHECYCKREDLHLENPHRLLVIYEKLKKSHLLDDCELIRGYSATIDMLTECHKYVLSVRFDQIVALIVLLVLPTSSFLLVIYDNVLNNPLHF